MTNLVYGDIGSISHGTMRWEDLIPEFASTLKDLAERQKKAAPSFKNDFTDILKQADYVCENEHQTDIDPYDVLYELMDYLGEFSPPFCYFGAHEGDGSDYGFWPLNETDMKKHIENCDGIIVDDLSEVPEGFKGYVLLVNDHGNVSLYRDNREIWSIV